MATSHENPTFVGDDGRIPPGSHRSQETEATTADSKHKPAKERATWGNGLEFLMSCIAMSVGLGNVWRFPFTALDNGGGAFLIPYLIVLFLVGKPIYYLEMIIGQFSSRGSVKVYDLCPAMRGVGIGQVVSISMVTTYYVAIMGITMRYLYDSFWSPLPWSECRDSWNAVCVPSGESNTAEKLYASNSTTPSIDIRNTSAGKPTSSAELYFLCWHWSNVHGLPTDHLL